MPYRCALRSCTGVAVIIAGCVALNIGLRPKLDAWLVIGVVWILCGVFVVIGRTWGLTETRAVGSLSIGFGIYLAITGRLLEGIELDSFWALVLIGVSQSRDTFRGSR